MAVSKSMADLYVFIKNNMTYLVGFSAVLQIIGTLVLALFSFNGIKITASQNTYVNNKPITHVTLAPGWLAAAQIGLIILLLGIFISGIASIIGSVNS